VFEAAVEPRSPGIELNLGILASNKRNAMNSASEHDILNRLVVLYNRSLPMYLHYAVPWWSDRDGQAAELLEHIVADQSEMVDRLGGMIIESGGDVDNGEFPLSFTALHDLSFDYLLDQMIILQRRTITAIEKCVDLLPANRMSRPLAHEALGMAKAHLDSLCETAERLKSWAS
jgi:hypothetical protein